MHISVSLTDVHIIADTDYVGHEGDHVGCLAYSLAVSNLRFALVQILNLQARVELQAEAKEKRVRVELSRNKEMPRPLSNTFVEMLFSLMKRRASATRPHSLQLVVCLFPGQEEVVLVHFLEI